MGADAPIEHYDPVDHLNAIFSHPATLSSVSKTAYVLQAYQDDLDDEIDALEEQQQRANAECLQRMQASKDELADLFEKIESVRERAIQTEKKYHRDDCRYQAVGQHQEKSHTLNDRFEAVTDVDNRLRTIEGSHQDSAVS